VAVYELGVSTGAINSAVEVIDLEQINRPEFVPHHVVAGEWMGAEAFFDTDSSAIRSEAVPQLEGMLAEHLRGFSSPYGRLLIEGRASAPGTEEYNLALSQRRAQSVCAALQVMLGERLRIPEESIELVGLGEGDAPGGPDGPDLQEARRVDVFMDTDLMIGY
jgi:outer membrane protein OmpA-like peptidoglycan-associated protein